MAAHHWVVNLTSVSYRKLPEQYDTGKSYLVVVAVVVVVVVAVVLMRWGLRRWWWRWR